MRFAALYLTKGKTMDQILLSIIGGAVGILAGVIIVIYFKI